MIVSTQNTKNSNSDAYESYLLAVKHGMMVTKEKKKSSLSLSSSSSILTMNKMKKNGTSSVHHHHNGLASIASFHNSNHNQKRCGIILYDPEKNKYLLVRGRDSKKWGFPKGHMENGEIEEETARREFYEETGLEIFGPFDGRVRYGNNIYFFKTQVENRDLQVRDMNEIDEIQWLSKTDILSFHKEQCNFGLSMWRKYLASKTEDRTDDKSLNRKDYMINNSSVNYIKDVNNIKNMNNIKDEDTVENSFQFPILYHYMHPEKKWFDRLSIPVRN